MRWIALTAVSINLLLTGILVVRGALTLKRKNQQNERILNGATKQSFEPEFIPGNVGNSHSTSWTLFDIPMPSGDGRVSSVQFFLGLDGLNIWLIALTSFLMVPSVLVSWESIKERSNEYYAWLLALQTAMLGVFFAFDVVLFYVFFELTLIPLFFLIGIWGGPARREAGASSSSIRWREV